MIMFRFITRYLETKKWYRFIFSKEPLYMNEIFENESHIKNTQENKIRNFIESNNQIAIVIGKWGVGKTATLKNIESKYNRDKSYIYVFRFRSFALVKSIKEAEYFLVPFYLRLLLFLGLGILGCLQNFHIKGDLIDLLMLLAAVFIGYKIFEDFLYWILIKLTYFFRSCRTNITIIEDLDRSQLSLKEKLNLISKIYAENKNKYIINLAYKNDDEFLDICEFANKMGVLLIHMQVDDLINAKLLETICSNTAFYKENGVYTQYHVWLSYFTPRDILYIQHKTSELCCNEKLSNVFLVYVLFHTLLSKIGFDEKFYSFLELANVTTPKNNSIHKNLSIRLNRNEIIKDEKLYVVIGAFSASINKENVFQPLLEYYYSVTDISILFEQLGVHDGLPQNFKQFLKKFLFNRNDNIIKAMFLPNPSG